MFHNFFHKFFRYFFQCIFLCKKFLKNSQFFCIARRFLPKKVKYFQDFFPTVNNTVKFGGIFCTAYIFVKYFRKNLQRNWRKKFQKFLGRKYCCKFLQYFLHCICSLLCISYFTPKFSNKKIGFFIVNNFANIFSKMVRICADIFATTNITVKICVFF